jgi:hypothetical protein
MDHHDVEAVHLTHRFTEELISPYNEGLLAPLRFQSGKRIFQRTKDQCASDTVIFFHYNDHVYFFGQNPAYGFKCLSPYKDEVAPRNYLNLRKILRNCVM